MSAAANGTALAQVETTNIIARVTAAQFDDALAELVAQKHAVVKAMQAVMREGEHYGVIPGTGKAGDKPKPSLLQPGADTLCFMFRLRPEYEVTKEERDDFVAITIRCRLFHIDSGKEVGSGCGSCNSREKRYQASANAKLCPRCRKPAIIKGKEEYGGGWICFAKKDGCGAKFKDDDETITAQSGQATATGVWDLHNTLLKMACKRARVDAVLRATAAGDLFTQDMEDLQEAVALYTPPPPKAATPAGASMSTEAQWLQLSNLAVTKVGLGWGKARASSWMKKRFGVTEPAGLTEKQATDAIELLRIRHDQGEDAYYETVEGMQAEGRVLPGGE